MSEASTEAGGLSTGALLLVGLAVGLAAGTKLNFLLPAAVLVLGLDGAGAERGGGGGRFSAPAAWPWPAAATGTCAT